MNLGIPHDYRLEDGEIDNLVYLTCKYSASWGMRAADLAVCQMLAGSPLFGESGVSRLVNVTTRYLWDHILGEPGGTYADDMYAHMVPMLEEWYRLASPEERKSTK
jgi:hypothetical protein